MKNKEKYDLRKLKIFVESTKDECLDILITQDKKTIHRDVIELTIDHYCTSQLLLSDYYNEWLEAEYVEPIRLTKNEKAILESLPKEYKWITRNIEHALLVHSIKPQNGTWDSNDTVSYMDVFNHLFNFIEAGNSKPYSIEELLKCEVVEDVD